MTAVTPDSHRSPVAVPNKPEPAARHAHAGPSRDVVFDTDDAALRSFSRLLGVWNHGVLEHGIRVSQYALRLAEAIGLGQPERILIRRGAMIHDVGKLAVPAAILDKPGPLAHDEFEAVKAHTVQGAYIIEPLAALEELLPFVRGHHERADGRGYPDGLRAGELSLAVRIVAVADVYDALASNRPYWAALSQGTCLDILRENAASGGLDPELTNVFCRLIEAARPPACSPTAV